MRGQPTVLQSVSRREFLKNSTVGAGLTAAGLGTESQGAVKTPQTEVGPAHFHHVHLNVTDPDESLRFYEFMFGAVPLKFRGVSDALFTERSFILLKKVDAPPPSDLRSGVWHIGWGGVDIVNEYAWWKAHGMDVHTPIYKLGKGYVTYWNGPNREVIELNTQGHHRFSHVHLMATDVNETARWYTTNLGLEARPERPKPRDLSKVRAWSSGFRCDNVTFIIYGKPDYDPPPPWWRWKPLVDFEPQKGRAIDHLAFSFRSIEPVFERMQQSGVEIVEPIRRIDEYNLKSFFVMAPDQVLVEIVEAKPIPEGVWDEPAPLAGA